MPELVTSYVVINLLRSGERIGSLTHWQPTQSRIPDSPELIGKQVPTPTPM